MNVQTPLVLLCSALRRRFSDQEGDQQKREQIIKTRARKLHAKGMNNNMKNEPKSELKSMNNPLKINPKIDAEKADSRHSFSRRAGGAFSPINLSADR